MIENKIKEIIVTRYGSVSHFCKKVNLPYTTVDSILKRGIANSNVLNVIKICDELNLSIDGLRHGIIKPVENEKISAKEFELLVKNKLEKTDIDKRDKQHILTTLEFICSDDEK